MMAINSVKLIYTVVILSIVLIPVRVSFFIFSLVQSLKKEVKKGKPQ